MTAAAAENEPRGDVVACPHCSSWFRAEIEALEGLTGEHPSPREDEPTALGTALDVKLPAAPAGEAILIIDTGRTVTLTKFQTTIGRRNADVLVDDVDVSRKHAVIERYEDKYLLKDEGSTNGTHLNGQRVSAEFLKDGDIIRLGKTVLTFRRAETL